MKFIIFFMFLALAVSCSQGDAVSSKNSITQETKPLELEEDCDDKASNFKEKKTTEISLDAPADEGCTL